MGVGGYGGEVTRCYGNNREWSRDQMTVIDELRQAVVDGS